MSFLRPRLTVTNVVSYVLFALASPSPDALVVVEPLAATESSPSAVQAAIPGDSIVSGSPSPQSAPASPPALSETTQQQSMQSRPPISPILNILQSTVNGLGL